MAVCTVEKPDSLGKPSLMAKEEKLIEHFTVPNMVYTTPKNGILVGELSGHNAIVYVNDMPIVSTVSWKSGVLYIGGFPNAKKTPNGVGLFVPKGSIIKTGTFDGVWYYNIKLYAIE